MTDPKKTLSLSVSICLVAGGDGKLMAILLDNILLGMIGESLIKFNVPGADFARDCRGGLLLAGIRHQFLHQSVVHQRLEARLIYSIYYSPASEGFVRLCEHARELSW